MYILIKKTKKMKFIYPAWKLCCLLPRIPVVLIRTFFCLSSIDCLSVLYYEWTFDIDFNVLIYYFYTICNSFLTKCLNIGGNYYKENICFLFWSYFIIFAHIRVLGHSWLIS